MPVAAAVGVMNPYWSTVAKAWLYVAAVDAGVTHTNATAHPFAGALGEYLITFDGNASHVARLLDATVGATEATTYPGFTGGSAPDNTRRWGIRRSFLFRYTGTNTSNALIMRSQSSTTGLFLNTDGTVTFTFFDSLSVTESYTSLGTLAINTWYLIDCWCITKDSSGNTLPQMQLVIRSSTLSAGAQGTVTTLINTLVNGTTKALADPVTAGSAAGFGESTTRGAGFQFFVGNVYSAWEDANDPYGVIRVDRLDPTAGNSAKNNQWTAAASGANIDESGTAEPNDATDFDSVFMAPGGVDLTKDQTYGLTNTAVATGSGDLIIRTIVGVRTWEAASGKGIYYRVYGLESDGTNNQLGAVQAQTSASTWASFYQGFDKSPAGAAWTTANLNSLEMGLRVASNDSSTFTYENTVVTTLVAYQANGETMPAVPGAPPKIPSLFVRQAVSRSNTY